MENIISRAGFSASEIKNNPGSVALWIGRQISRHRISNARRLTQAEIAKLPENLQKDIMTKHQEK